MKRRYTGIWTKAKELGMSDDEVYAFAFQRLELNKPIDSLKTLGEQNIDRLYRAIRKLDSKP